MRNNKMMMVAEMREFNNEKELVVMSWELEGEFFDGNTAYANIWDDEMDSYYDVDEQWEHETAQWLREHSGNPDAPNYDINYSDIYKELYGFRPRWQGLNYLQGVRKHSFFLLHSITSAHMQTYFA